MLKQLLYFQSSTVFLQLVLTFCRFASARNEVAQTNWISVEDRPLFTIDENGHWVCTEDGDKEFIAAVACEEPSGIKWWIRHCVVEDSVGLCIVGDYENEPAGYMLSDVTHWQPLPTPPKH